MFDTPSTKEEPICHILSKDLHAPLLLKVALLRWTKIFGDLRGTGK